ncbi:MAG TPA: hypothetical protein VJH95_04490, partial [Candidatus Nanoarchaeia archaeon]|nr:hypothetical protein [Candidatus Nanoarchaeia archaeon]
MKKQTILELIILASILIFLLAYFKPSLILSKTITSGGDTASHYPTAVFLKENLFPLRISGWSQGNYAGSPLFQFYFPLTFYLMAALSYLIPMQVAFKL